MDKRPKEATGFINFTCNELHDLVDKLYESYFDTEGNIIGVGSNLNDSLFDIKLYVDDVINQINSE